MSMITSSEADEQGPSPSGSLDVNTSLTCPPISFACAVYVAVTFAPVVVLEVIVPNPKPGTIDQVPTPALPPIEPLNGMVTGSHTEKLAPALAVATGLTVTVTTVGGPAQLFAVGVIV